MLLSERLDRQLNKLREEAELYNGSVNPNMKSATKWGRRKQAINKTAKAVGSALKRNPKLSIAAGLVAAKGAAHLARKVYNKEKIK